MEKNASKLHTFPTENDARYRSNTHTLIKFTNYNG
jgi:hypothetical protein